VPKPLKDLPLALEFHPQGLPHPVESGLEGATGGDGGVKLAKGTGSGVSRIGERGFPFFRALSVQCLKILPLHVDLAPDSKELGNRSAVTWHIQAPWNGADGFHVGG